MLKIIGRTISLMALGGGIVITFTIVFFMIAIALLGEDKVIRAVACQVGVGENCLRQELLQERKKLQQMQERNAKMEALLERLAKLDHASSSYVVFYINERGKHEVTTGHTYASLLDPNTLIGAHCYINVFQSGAGRTHIDLGNMKQNKSITLKTYKAADLAAIGLTNSEYIKLQSRCRWPNGAR